MRRSSIKKYYLKLVFVYMCDGRQARLRAVIYFYFSALAGTMQDSESPGFYQSIIYVFNIKEQSSIRLDI